MKKKILVVLMCLLTIFMLVGCGKKQEEEKEVVTEETVAKEVNKLDGIWKLTEIKNEDYDEYKALRAVLTEESVEQFDEEMKNIKMWGLLQEGVFLEKMVVEDYEYKDKKGKNQYRFIGYEGYNETIEKENLKAEQVDLISEIDFFKEVLLNYGYDVKDSDMLVYTKKYTDDGKVDVGDVFYVFQEKENRMLAINEIGRMLVDKDTGKIVPDTISVAIYNRKGTGLNTFGKEDKKELTKKLSDIKKNYEELKGEKNYLNVDQFKKIKDKFNALTTEMGIDVEVDTNSKSDIEEKFGSVEDLLSK